MVHQVVKPEKIAATAAVLLEESLVVPAVFRREGIDQYKGAEDDTITVKVEGVLPFRTYGWRNDRSTEIQFDEYKEKKVAVTFGGDIYSGVKLTDEQNDFDLPGWSKLARKQTEAIGHGLEWQASEYVKTAPYEVELGVAANALRSGLIRARATMNRLRVPAGQRTILVGTNWEAALLEDEKLNLASNVGEAEAVSALREATLGRRYGFNFVVAQELDPDTAIAMVDSAFIFATGAPSVPQSVPLGATASYNGVALRWIRDYDSLHTTDRSIFNTYKGFRNVSDMLIGVDQVTGQAYTTEYEHFVRAIKLNLNGSDVLPDPDGDDEKATELGNVTGLWKVSDNAASADATVIPVSTVKNANDSAATPTAPKAAKGEILVTAGAPGKVTAGSSTAAALVSLAALNAAVTAPSDGIKVNVLPISAWTTGQHVLLADGTTHVNWTGTAFATGDHA